MPGVGDGVRPIAGRSRCVRMGLPLYDSNGPRRLAAEDDLGVPDSVPPSAHMSVSPLERYRCGPSIQIGFFECPRRRSDDLARAERAC